MLTVRPDFYDDFHCLASACRHSCCVGWEIDVDAESPAASAEPLVDKPMEMLTIKECAALVDGLSEHTVRMLCSQDKIAHVRAGAGRNGKILVSKVSLLKYLGIAG